MSLLTSLPPSSPPSPPYGKRRNISMAFFKTFHCITGLVTNAIKKQKGKGALRFTPFYVR
jgi:hypothetical protein